MFNGWVPRDFAESHHPLWYEELSKLEKNKITQEKSVA
jgi:cytochrome b subunit of formate dehydrogenase